MITNRISDCSVELELDISVTDLNQFINYINPYVISDLSIEELPIESVVKELYTKE